MITKVTKEYSLDDLGLPDGARIISATAPFDGLTLSVAVQLPTWDLRPSIEEDGQGVLFSPS